MGPIQVASTEAIKELRVQADALFRAIRSLEESEDAGQEYDDEMYCSAKHQAFLAAKSAKMWLGTMLEGKGNDFPKELADKSENAS